MLNYIVRSITNNWAESGFISDKDKDIYEYGLNLVLFSALNLFAILLTALITERLVESVILIAVTVPLQMFGGGYHAKTHLKCFLIMYLGWWVVMLVAPIMNTFVTMCIIVLSVSTIFWFAPVAHKNVPISVGQRNKMKMLTRKFVVICAIISIFFASDVTGVHKISSHVAIGLGAIAISMVAGKLKYL